jgi:GT2 family glycosyltransferase
MVDIGIVIVNYNVRHFLVQCLESIRKSRTEDLKTEVWVVDNASVDGAIPLLKKDFPEVRLIENTENVGFSKANNQAIQQLKAKYILLLNPDTILEENTLSDCFFYMEDRKEAGALGVRMIDGNGIFLPESKRKIPDLWNSFCKLTYLSKIFPSSRLFSGYNLGYLPENEIADIEVLCGAFMFIRKEVLDKTGYLDERFFMYGEDIDLSYRILKAGYKIVYFPKSTIIHFKGESTKKASLQYVRTFYGAMSLYVNKHYAGKRSDLFRWFILIAIQMRAVLSLVGKFFSVLVRMLVDGLTIAGLLYLIKKYWAYFYFGDPDYYQGTSIGINIILYTTLWVLSLWFFGRYDKNKKRYRLGYAVLTGLILILVVYALEPLEFRTSRALILLGSLGTFLYVLSSEFLLSTFQKPKKPSLSTVIVAPKTEAEKIKIMMGFDDKESGEVYVINPGEDTGDPYYTNHIKNLDKTVSQLKADQLIFSSAGLPIRDIMEYMTKLTKKVDYKIAGDESLGIIGKKIPGKNLYSLDIHFPLEDGFWRRTKMITDMMISGLFILLLPIVFVLNVGRIQAIRNIFLVFIQKKTWIGYGGDITDYRFLPDIPKGVIVFPMAKRAIRFYDGYFKDKNLEYAKSYNPWSDLALVFSNITNLHGK